MNILHTIIKYFGILLNVSQCHKTALCKMRKSTLKIVYIYRSNTWSETFTRKSLRHSKFRQIEWAVVRGMILEFCW